jgi:hypothetical protein
MGTVYGSADETTGQTQTATKNKTHTELTALGETQQKTKVMSFESTNKDILRFKGEQGHPRTPGQNKTQNEDSKAAHPRH